ncbi:hypothetical protein EHS11_17200 [Leptospira ilyithenensis]|uniref:Uncharacterized protein n=1 Tax=Leptospira ilyithenensis TaxID=2484901 RepID=A0A4R9LNY6_9LEPT|nr:bifunctional hydroxymethylpyrimidine kinase/phosphomethylpyrimidine kinase [Leptospira ilyithenensis]TGN07202.1 hypothetical protein EHS11_17200 [Leptospira ilyithenensis]
MPGKPDFFQTVSFLTYGLSLPEAVGHAKEYIHNAIEDSIQTGPTTHLNHFPEG